MNTSKIKAYAPQARRDFIQAVTERANLYGIFDDNKIESLEMKGDVALIGERVWLVPKLLLGTHDRKLSFQDLVPKPEFVNEQYIIIRKK